MPTSEAQKRASMKYDSIHMKQYCLRLHKITDSDVIDKLDSVDNRNGYIKNLIRKDIKNTPDAK